MPKQDSTPARRAADAKKTVSSVRRKYKVDVHKQSRLMPGEIPHVKQMVAILHLAHYSKTQIARIIGISRDQVAAFLNADDVVELVVDLRAKIPAAATELLQAYMIEAVQVIVDVMRSEPDGKIRLQAAADVLDRGGMPKLSKSERLQINDERTTITDDGMLDRLRELPPELQEQAAQMIEGLEGLLTQANDGAMEDEDA